MFILQKKLFLHIFNSGSFSGNFFQLCYISVHGTNTLSQKSKKKKTILQNIIVRYTIIYLINLIQLSNHKDNVAGICDNMG